MIYDAFHILIVFFGIISITLALIGRFETAKKISPVIMILFLSALLANVGIIPTEHNLYKQLSGYAIPFAVCLILFHVRLADIKKTGLPMLKAFALASAGSIVGCLLAGLVFRDRLDQAMAGQGWKLAGPYIGTYIGGSLNFISMWSGLEIDNPDLFAAANAVDNLTLIPLFMFWVLSPLVLKRWYPEAAIEVTADANTNNDSPTVLKSYDLIRLVLIAFLVIALSDLIKKYIAVWMPQLPTILITTTLALILAQVKYITRLQGAKELGNFAFYLFFAVIGAMMDIPKAVCLAPVLFVYVLLIIVTQIVFVLLLGRLLKMDFRM